MTIPVYPQGSDLRYIPITQLNDENITDLTGVSRQYAEDILRVKQVALHYWDEKHISERAHQYCADMLMIKNNRNIELCNELIQKNKEDIYLTNHYAEKYFISLVFCTIFGLGFVAFSVMHIGHGMKWWRIIM